MIRRFPPGEEAPAGSVRPGDLIFTHRKSVISRLIRLSQRWRFRSPNERPFAYWSHCAIVVSPSGDLVEAETKGVQLSPLSKYRGVEYHLVTLGASFEEEDRRRAVGYSRARIGDAFGFLVLVSLSIWLLSGWRVRLARADHQICSGLVAHALQEGGQLKALDPTFVLPADVAMAIDARP